MSTPGKQVILGAYLGGVNHHTSWWHSEAGSQIDFSSFEHTARTAERGKFDFFFLAEGLILRERAGKIFDQDIIGRPDTFTVLASIAAVTEHLGLGARSMPPSTSHMSWPASSPAWIICPVVAPPGMW